MNNDITLGFGLASLEIHIKEIRKQLEKAIKENDEANQHRIYTQIVKMLEIATN
jgi:hypothetical protein